jgi:hypothetical protein
MKTSDYYYIGIVIVGVVSALVIFASMPSDTWRDHRTEFVGVASPDELNEKIDCLSKGGVWDYTSCNFKAKGEHYEIEITGLKDVYLVGERYDFSYIISGYGYQCGGKKISFPDQNGDYAKIISSSSCIADVPMEEFVFDIQKERGTTYGHIELKNPGTYTVTVTFDRPNQYLPTIISKEFQVVSYINSERDTKLAAGYKLYPGVGWVHPDDLGNQKPIYKTHPNNSSELILDLDAMLQYQKVLDWCHRESLGLGVFDIGLSFNNETHFIDNNNCKWKKIENEN